MSPEFIYALGLIKNVRPLQSINLLTSGVEVFAEKCIKGIKANRAKCAAGIEQSPAMVTGLVPHIGYDKAAGIAQKAYEKRKGRDRNFFSRNRYLHPLQ